MFFPYYEADIKAGRITPGQARELCEELFLKIMTHNMRPYSNFTGAFNQRYEGSEPVTLGGQRPDGSDACNELTYLMLQAAERSKASLNFVVRFHKNSPAALYDTVADLHYHGTSSVSMMNDEKSIEAMMRHGFTEQDARGYAITGCVDMVAPGKTGGEGFSSILMCRVMDAALRNGDSKTLMGAIRGVGPRTGDPDTFDSFDQLVDAFAAQAAHAMRSIVKASRIRDQLFAQHLPCPAISAFMQGCMEKKKDVTAGGAIYDLEGVLVMNSIANTVDSLFVIKKLVFEQKKYTVKQILDAVDHNFKGYEQVRRDVLGVPGKWGNGNPECDALARRITDAVFNETYKYTTYKGGRYAPFINSMTSHTIDGRLSTATPDGRLAATPFAASCNPYNVESNRPTGVLRSVAAIDFSHVLGCAVNIRMHPSAIGATPESRAKWGALVRTYFHMGGEQLQPTVVSTQTLRAAQQDPDSYRNIIVKVGGYSAYFTDLGREIQDEIISRTEHAM
jgi:formate C-acetyltransferase